MHKASRLKRGSYKLSENQRTIDQPYLTRKDIGKKGLRQGNKLSRRRRLIKKTTCSFPNPSQRNKTRPVVKCCNKGLSPLNTCRHRRLSRRKISGLSLKIFATCTTWNRNMCILQIWCIGRDERHWLIENTHIRCWLANLREKKS